MTVLYSWTYLDETKGLLEHALHCVHLRMVELWKARGGEATEGKLSVRCNDRACTALASWSAMLEAPDYGQGACGTNEVEASAIEIEERSRGLTM